MSQELGNLVISMEGVKFASPNTVCQLLINVMENIEIKLTASPMNVLDLC